MQGVGTCQDASDSLHENGGSCRRAAGEVTYMGASQ